MQRITFLGHDNASLSMLIESLYQCFNNNFSIEVVRIVGSDPIEHAKIPFLLEGIEFIDMVHDDWMPSVDSDILLGTMVAQIKKKIYSFFNENYGLEHEQYKTIIHPGAEYSNSSTWKQGTSLGPGAILAPFCELGHHVSINRSATIGHHSKLNDFVTVNPGVNIAGFCRIGEGTTIGMGANIIDGKKIGKNVTIGAGSLVTKDIPDNVVAYGVPAKVVREKQI